MWEPQAGWQRLPGAGPSTVGVWRATVGGRDAAVKRLRSPQAHDPAELREPAHPAYWRRAADVAVSGLVDATSGLRAPELLSAEEDDDGVTLVHAWVEACDNSGLFLARSLGRLAGEPVPSAGWLARHQLRRRMEQVERRGGWTTVARTPVADWADHLWRRRVGHLERLAALPQVLQHGDPVPSNLLGRHEDDVVAVDWATCGLGPAGADLGYLSLSTRESFEPLLDAYLAGLAERRADVVPAPDPDDVRYAARVTAVFTVLTRVDWALSRVVPGEGALAGKFRHPSVAPYLRSLQQHLDQVEALLT